MASWQEVEDKESDVPALVTKGEREPECEQMELKMNQLLGMSTRDWMVKGWYEEQMHC